MSELSTQFIECECCGVKFHPTNDDILLGDTICPSCDSWLDLNGNNIGKLGWPDED